MRVSADDEATDGPSRVSATAPVWAALLALVALLAAAAVARRLPPAPFKHHQSLDGLRGLAAVAVYIHHGAIWYGLNHTGRWTLPPSNLYIQLGQGGVTLFFLITGFLFWEKIREDRPVDWLRLYVSRAFRLLPLFCLSLALILLFAGVATGFARPLLPHGHYAGALADTLAMFPHGVPAFFGAPDLYFYNAGVTWSLCYELFFYACLPALFLLKSRRQSPVRLLVLAAVLVPLWRFFLYCHLAWLFLRIFFIGVICREAVGADSLGWLRRILSGRTGGLLALTMLALIVHGHGSAFDERAELLYGGVFLIAATGNDLFGLLTATAARKLGEIAYGIYLLQGFVLYLAFRHVRLSPAVHWGLATLALLALIAVASVTYHAIEAPCLRRAAPLAARLRLLAARAAALTSRQTGAV